MRDGRYVKVALAGGHVRALDVPLPRSVEVPRPLAPLSAPVKTVWTELPLRDRFVVGQRLGLNGPRQTFSELGVQLGVTSQTVQRIELRGLAAILTSVGREQLRPLHNARRQMRAWLVLTSRLDVLEAADGAADERLLGIWQAVGLDLPRVLLAFMVSEPEREYGGPEVAAELRESGERMRGAFAALASRGLLEPPRRTRVGNSPRTFHRVALQLREPIKALLPPWVERHSRSPTKGSADEAPGAAHG